MKESDNTQQMLREAVLLLRSMEFAETQIKRLLWDLEEAEKQFDEELQAKLRKSVNIMLRRIANEDKNVELFVKKYKGILNEKEKSLFNTRKK